MPSPLDHKTPFQPLTSFDSPCWVSYVRGGASLRCFPAVYLVGFAKSGTTDIFSNLQLHKLIFTGRKKELHYWNFRRLAYWNRRGLFLEIANTYMSGTKILKGGRAPRKGEGGQKPPKFFQRGRCVCVSGVGCASGGGDINII